VTGFSPFSVGFLHKLRTSKLPMYASVKSAFSTFAPSKLVPVKTALAKMVPFKLDPLKLALSTIAFVKSAPSKLLSTSYKKGASLRSLSQRTLGITRGDQCHTHHEGILC
jgi:hypothetical protein